MMMVIQHSSLILNVDAHAQQRSNNPVHRHRAITAVETATATATATATTSSPTTIVNEKNKQHVMYEGSEHRDATSAGQYVLMFASPSDRGVDSNLNYFYQRNYSAQSYEFTSGTGYVLRTYGDIVAMAGDYYGPTNWPSQICNPINGQWDSVERQNIFTQAFNKLWLTQVDTDGVDYIPQPYLNELYENFNLEQSAVQYALDHNLNPATFIGDLGATRYFLTQNMLSQAFNVKDGLESNWDHFSVDDCNRMAYRVGHRWAMVEAQRAGQYLFPLSAFNRLSSAERTARLKAAHAKLTRAYVANAFADHFLSDQFASGHMRTPRKQLTDFCNGGGGPNVNQMHNEDNMNGLKVRNVRGDVFWTYGDGKYSLNSNSLSRKIHSEAAQASKNDIWNAFVGSGLAYTAERLVPIKESWVDFPNDNTMPLYRVVNNQVQIRTRIDQIRSSASFQSTTADVRDNFGMNTYSFNYKYLNNPTVEYRAMMSGDCISSVTFGIANAVEYFNSLFPSVCYIPSLKGYYNQQADASTYYWSANDWSSCSNRCGTNIQTRTFVCKQKVSFAIDPTVADSFCHTSGDTCARGSSVKICSFIRCTSNILMKFSSVSNSWNTLDCQDSTPCSSWTVSSAAFSPTYQFIYMAVNVPYSINTDQAYTVKIEGINNDFQIYQSIGSLPSSTSYQKYVDQTDAAIPFSSSFYSCKQTKPTTFYLLVRVYQNRLMDQTVKFSVQQDENVIVNYCQKSSDDGIIALRTVDSTSYSALVEVQPTPTATPDSASSSTGDSGGVGSTSNSNGESGDGSDSSSSGTTSTTTTAAAEGSGPGQGSSNSGIVDTNGNNSNFSDDSSNNARLYIIIGVSIGVGLLIATCFALLVCRRNKNAAIEPSPIQVSTLPPSPIDRKHFVL